MGISSRALLFTSVAITLGISMPVQASIISTTGAIVVIAPPANTGTGDLENNTKIRAFAEQQSVLLAIDTKVDVTQIGTAPTATSENLTTGTITAGTRVNSYFLHFDDVRVLLKVFQRLVEAGNSIIVIEHNLDVVKSADWVIDLGPDAGDRGGRIVATGTPEQIAENEHSHTGRALAEILEESQYA